MVRLGSSIRFSIGEADFKSITVLLAGEKEGPKTYKPDTPGGPSSTKNRTVIDCEVDFGCRDVGRPQVDVL